MWTPLITIVALVLLTAASAATAVALVTTDRERTRCATTVLKIVIGALLGSGGLFAVAVRLHQAGLL